MTPKPFDTPLRWLVPSASRPGESHLVELDAYNGNGKCSCADFTCRHEALARTGQGGVAKTRCKHIKRARSALLDSLIKEIASSLKLLLLFLPSLIWAAPSPQFIDALAMTESRGIHSTVADNGLALGAFCFHKAAWSDASAILVRQGNKPVPYATGAHCPEQAKAHATALIGSYEKRLRARGLEPTAERLWLCWTMGFKGAERIEFKAAKAPAYKQRGLSRLQGFLGAYSPTVP